MLRGNRNDQTNPNRLGINSEICGTNVMINSTTISTNKNGKIARYMRMSEIFATLDVTKSVMPIGGEISPIHRLIVTIIAKWIGWMLNEAATGNKIGTMISSAGA